MFFKTNKCIFIGVRMKAFTMQSKNKIGVWAHMRPPLNQIFPINFSIFNYAEKILCILQGHVFLMGACVGKKKVIKSENG